MGGRGEGGEGMEREWRRGALRRRGVKMGKGGPGEGGEGKRGGWKGMEG
jgi:hypothetical protein